MGDNDEDRRYNKRHAFRGQLPEGVEPREKEVLSPGRAALESRIARRNFCKCKEFSNRKEGVGGRGRAERKVEKELAKVVFLFLAFEPLPKEDKSARR